MTANILPRNFAPTRQVPRSNSDCACNASRVLLNWCYDLIRENNVCVDSETVVLPPLKAKEPAEDIFVNVFSASSNSDTKYSATASEDTSPTEPRSVEQLKQGEERRVVKFRAKKAELEKQKISVVFVSGKEGYGRVKITVHERELCKCKKNGKIVRPCFEHLPFFCIIKPGVNVSLWWKPYSNTNSMEVFADVLVLDHEVKFCQTLKMTPRRKRNLWRELLCGSLPEETDCEGDENDWVQFPHYIFEYRNHNLAARARSGCLIEVPFPINTLHDLRFLLDNGTLTLFSNKYDLRSLCSNLELYDVVVAINNTKNDEKTISIEIAPTIRLHLCETVRLDSSSHEV